MSKKTSEKLPQSIEKDLETTISEVDKLRDLMDLLSSFGPTIDYPLPEENSFVLH